MNSVLKVLDVKKSFVTPSAGSIDVLRGINLEINSSVSVSMRGESGAGKTTFLNIAAALEKPDSGEVLWNGKRIDNLSNSKQASARASFMGFVFQSYCLVPELNVVENVLLASRIANKYNLSAKKRALEILEKVGLKDRVKYLPKLLSGGEKQRVAIARALINKPSLILADEPTGNLDERTGLGIMNMFLDLCKNENVALLLITHNSDFAARTDLSLALKDGILV